VASRCVDSLPVPWYPAHRSGGTSFCVAHARVLSVDPRVILSKVCFALRSLLPATGTASTVCVFSLSSEQVKLCYSILLLWGHAHFGVAVCLIFALFMICLS
jgi:hypothetical protein